MLLYTKNNFVQSIIIIILNNKIQLSLNYRKLLFENFTVINHDISFDVDN